MSPTDSRRSKTDQADGRGDEASLAETAGEETTADEQAANNTSEAQDVATLREELAQVREHALRAQAELENFRKRSRRDMQEELRYANLPLLRDLLPVWDNIHRAADAAKDSAEAEPLVAGVRMVAQLLEDVFRQHHCTLIDALHHPFDPHRHEALSRVETAEHPPGTVVQVVRDGFELHDRVVRPAQVIIAAAPPEDSG